MVTSSAGKTQILDASRPGRKLPRAAVALICVVLFQILFASVFLGVLHRPALHHAPVAVVGFSPVANAVSRHSNGAIRLISEPTVQAARAAIRDGQAYAAIVAGPRGESLLIQTAASPGTASLLIKGLSTAAAALKVPLAVRDLAPLPASDPTGSSAYFLIAGWVLGGYVGATVLALASGGMRSSSLRQAAGRLGWLRPLRRDLRFRPGAAVRPGAGRDERIQRRPGRRGRPGRVRGGRGDRGLRERPEPARDALIAIIGMVVFGNPARASPSPRRCWPPRGTSSARCCRPNPGSAAPAA